MKANRSFKQNDEAVSPVIGVILMVAITVVLAAVVFVLVGNLTGDSAEAAPNIIFSKTGGDDAVVQSAPTGVNAVTWSTITFGGSCGNGSPLTLANNVTGIASTDNVQAGHIITGNCTAGTSLILSYVPSSGSSSQLSTLNY